MPPNTELEEGRSGYVLPTWVLCVGLVILTWALYGRCLEFEFTNWDDKDYIVENSLLQRSDLGAVATIFTPKSIPKESLYIPLTYLSYWVEIRLFGLSSLIIHAVNVLLHCVNALLVLAVLGLAYPLEQSLERNIDLGKPQPSSYPLTQAVAEAIEDYVRKLPDVRIVAAGRPSSLYAEADVQIYLTSPRLMPRSYANDIMAIVRGKMNNPELIVNVIGLKNEWQQEED